jgi:uncharacterized membrane protein YozB (DUF420 family)
VDLISWLPHVNASLNLLATILLVTGFIFIKRKNIAAHKATMMSCFGVSVIFLACYLTYHANAGSKKFPRAEYSAGVGYFYYAVLATHVILAAVVPFLAVTTIVLGLREKIESHRRLASWTFPIWLYVSVTGVVVYLMLYILFPTRSG